MENTQLPKIPTEQTQPENQSGHQPVTPTPEQTETLDVNQKEALAQTKKKKFKKILKISGIAALVLLLIPLSINFYKKYLLKNEPVVQTVEEENRKAQIEDVEVKKMVQADSGLLKLTLDYPEDAFILDTEENGIKKLEISYSPSTSEPQQTIDEGYIFKVSTFTTQTRTLKEAVYVKKDSFTATCPETSEISQIEGTNVSTTPALSFSVTNCAGDYKLTYTEKFGAHYEFMQFYKGDFGYKQRYRAATEDILRSIKFYPEETLGPTTIFKNEVHGFSFEHPNFDPDCCDITGSILSGAEKLTVLADPASVSDLANFDGFGIFIEKPSSDINFEEYLELQRKTLIDDYVVVKGKAPSPEEITVKVGDKNGILFKNYSWRGNDLIFIDISTENTFKILVVSVLNTSGDSFTETFNTILRSFKFF